MQALPLSRRTGQADGRGGELVTLDDVGATVLHIAGLDPAHYDYSGRILDFLVGAGS
jgi:hypothetical protein